MHWVFLIQTQACNQARIENSLFIHLLFMQSGLRLKHLTNGLMLEQVGWNRSLVQRLSRRLKAMLPRGKRPRQLRERRVAVRGLLQRRLRPVALEGRKSEMGSVWCWKLACSTLLDLYAVLPQRNDTARQVVKAISASLVCLLQGG